MAVAADEQPLESGDALESDDALDFTMHSTRSQDISMPSMLGWSTSRSHCSPTNRCGSAKATTPPELFPAWRTGFAANRVHQVVAIARRAAELPDCVDAFRRGELAIDQMAAIANRAPWLTDIEICDLAKFLTVGQLRRTLAKYPFPDIPSPDDASDPADPGPTADEPDNARSGDVVGSTA